MNHNEKKRECIETLQKALKTFRPHPDDFPWAPDDEHHSLQTLVQCAERVITGESSGYDHTLEQRLFGLIQEAKRSESKLHREHRERDNMYYRGAIHLLKCIGAVEKGRLDLAHDKANCVAQLIGDYLAGRTTADATS